MRIEITIKYKAKWGEYICLTGSSPETGAWDESLALPMSCTKESEWKVVINVSRKTSFKYSFLIKDTKGNIVRRESGRHSMEIDANTNKDYIVETLWLDKSDLSLQTSPFKECFFSHTYKKISTKENTRLTVHCIEVEQGQALVILGENELGGWSVENATRLIPVEYGCWEAVLPLLNSMLEYKLAIVDIRTQAIIRWESGENRIMPPSESSIIHVEEVAFRNGDYRWRGAGVAIPVFSLRTKNSFGVGEFSDLKEMIDWASLVGMRVVQVLPVNDTSMTGTWKDSYPYNAISIYALHPIYLGLHEYPLRSKKRMKFYLERKDELESLTVLDYEKVIALKKEYLHELFEERGEKVASQSNYQTFVSDNEDWLFAYACFCYLRDKNKTANYREWGRYANYTRASLEKLLAKDVRLELYIKEVYFVQYLLQKQLKDVRKYALSKGVVLKGDIPIGISRDSVEAWVEPHLFNLDTQTGAPPDDFAVEGQNWGFPTYNWDEMAKDGYRWWIRRFGKMAEYFDVYRIDHILGFFRIWEIPIDAVQGLLGYFSPALPLSSEDLRERGLFLTEDRLLHPFIDEDVLQLIFGDRAEKVENLYLDRINENFFQLKESVNTQRKIEESVQNAVLKNSLYTLCANVLFIRDKKELNKFHPRISAQSTSSYKNLTDEEKYKFDEIYEDFFFYRHSEFWKSEAMKKLPPLISSTDMLVCGEDLGMIPASVPEVMHELDILSLEIQRMPKTFGVQFEDLSQISYKSVCATSTHDMAPIRLWWKEDRERTKSFCSHVLGVDTPDECTPKICEKIIDQHLASPAMLSIHPLQDWLSISADLRRANEEEEQINIPANPNHYWQYRMHLNVEELQMATKFNAELREIMLKNKRTCNESGERAS